MLTIDEINKALREVDPEASVEFVLHDEITVACSQEHTDAVNQRLGKLLCESLLTLQIYQDETDTVIAYSPEDAVLVWEAQTGEDYEATTGAGSEVWTLYQYPTLRLVHPDEDLADEVRTVTEWVTKEGRAWLGSTEY